MKRLTLEVETLTPLFLAGEDQRVAELRTPSVRGVLRYWFRAMMGGIIGDNNVSKLRNLEALVFGDTKRASRVIVKVGDSPRTQAFPRPRELPGLGYLFFSMPMQNRECIPTGSRFYITLQERPLPQDAESNLSSEQVMAAVIGSLWLLMHLGGLGSRARRCGGNLRGLPGKVEIKAIKPESTLGSLTKNLLIKTNSIEGLRKHLEKGLRQIKEEFENLVQARSTPSENPKYTVIHPNSYNLWLLRKTWKSWEDALDEMGMTYRDFRNRRHPDYGNVKALLQRRAGAPRTIERAAFGLPLRFYYRSLRGATATVQGQEHDRRASPLSFRLLRLANGRYAMLVSFSKAEFLPGRERLKIRGETCAQPSFDIIEEFIEELGRKMGIIGVTVP
jgi:CRISPR-associated protein Cmr1